MTLDQKAWCWIVLILSRYPSHVFSQIAYVCYLRKGYFKWLLCQNYKYSLTWMQSKTHIVLHKEKISENIDNKIIKLTLLSSKWWFQMRKNKNLWPMKLSSFHCFSWPFPVMIDPAPAVLSHNQLIAPSWGGFSLPNSHLLLLEFT